MPLVEPLLPSHLSEMIWGYIPVELSPEEILQLVELSQSLQKAADEISSHDSRYEQAERLQTVKECLQVFMARFREPDHQVAAAQRCFAACLLQVSHQLRLHNLLAAKCSFETAWITYRENSSLIGRNAALESLGLAGLQIQELEEKLSRYKNCF